MWPAIVLCFLMSLSLAIVSLLVIYLMHQTRGLRAILRRVLSLERRRVDRFRP